MLQPARKGVCLTSTCEGMWIGEREREVAKSVVALYTPPISLRKRRGSTTTDVISLHLWGLLLT